MADTTTTQSGDAENPQPEQSATTDSAVELTAVVTKGSNEDAAAPGAASGKFKFETPKHFQSASRSAILEWNDIKFSVKQRGKSKQILQGVSGSSTPGAMLALMGPSGAGKSSLLNILACRTQSTRSKSIEVTGTVKCNGRVVDPNAFRKEVAYVMQDDVMYAYQTPREAFRFSAKLRLDASRTVQERDELVEWVIKVLGLEQCADTRIGNIKVSGISGGERKRTAIGIELISSPTILFLDEPTSGLDSYAAYNVVKVLTELSEGGCTVIATIHQPSSEVFDLFTNTLLLAQGRTIFNGTCADMLPHFGSLGHQCPESYNPADFVMFLMQKQSDTELMSMADAWDEVEAKLPATPLAMIQDAAQSESIVVNKPNCCVQLGWLSQRTFVNFGRDTSSLLARLMITAVQNLVVAFVFFGVGRDYENLELNTTLGPDAAGALVTELQTVLNAHFGILFFVAIGALFGLAQPQLLSFPTERPIFLREHAVGTYHAIPYFLSKLFVEVPVGILQMGVVFVCTQWVVGLNGNFFFLVLATALLGLVSAATAILIGAFVPTVETAIQSAPLTFVPQILFAGFFIPIALIPEWLRWAQYLCALKYGINILLLVEFSDVPASWGNISEEFYYTAVYGCPNKTVDCDNRLEAALFPRNEITPSSIGVYIGIMFGIFALFRAIAAIVLAARSRSST